MRFLERQITKIAAREGAILVRTTVGQVRRTHLLSDLWFLSSLYRGPN